MTNSYDLVSLQRKLQNSSKKISDPGANCTEQEDEEEEETKMEKSKAFVEGISKEESALLSSLTFPPHRVSVESSFYEYYAIRGIRVDRVEPGFVSCTFKVPRRLTDRDGKLASGAIANLVDEVGGAVVHVEGLPMNVSVDMSISYLSAAKFDDELEIIGQCLGKRGGYSGTSVLVRNKLTGELIAEGRHSLFGRHESKM